jgi:hypothetical protein
MIRFIKVSLLAAVATVFFSTSSPAQTLTFNLPVFLNTNQVTQLQYLRRYYGMTNVPLAKFATNVIGR